MPADNRWVTQQLRAMRKDPSAFEQLYAEMKQAMFVVAYRTAMSQEDAEDAVQDAFVRLLRSPKTETVRNGRAYLFQTVRNAALDIVQKRNREIAVAEPGEVRKGFVTRTGDGDIGAALETLAAEERQIVSLHLEAGLGYSEIARIMGVSTATAFRRYRAAIRSLREYYGRRRDGEEQDNA